MVYLIVIGTIIVEEFRLLWMEVYQNNFADILGLGAQIWSVLFSMYYLCFPSTGSYDFILVVSVVNV